MTSTNICDVLEQKRRLAIYNIPPIRLNLVSPYQTIPPISQYQLNMRRKVEILKYSTNTDRNSFTKKQSYSYLVNNRVQKAIANTLECNTTPTLSTSCDIPGAPVVLQLDPNVPLYNYGNYLQNRAYATIDEVDTSTFNFYTKNVIQYVEELLHQATPDLSLVYQHVTIPIGSLIIGQSIQSNNYAFSFNIPIAFWFTGSLKSGYDSNGVFIQKPSITDTDILTFHITDISLNILYNGSTIQPLQSAVITKTIIDCSFHLNVLQEHKQFYAIQYIGMLSINNLILQSPPSTIYDITVGFNYTYDNVIAYKLDYIQTGIFANIDTAFSSDYLFRCSLDSISPNDFSVGSFTHYIIN